jgi:hypothetical protein
VHASTRAVAISLVVTSRAAEPSLTRLEMPAVTFPSISPKRSVRSASANARRRPANASTVDPGLMVSSASSCPTPANAMTQARKLLNQAKTPQKELDHRQAQMDAEQEQILASARAEADRLREQALEGAIARRAEAQAKAERILDEAKTSGRGLEFGGTSEDDTCSLLWRFRVERRLTPQTPVTANQPCDRESRLGDPEFSRNLRWNLPLKVYLSIDNRYVPKWTAPRR